MYLFDDMNVLHARTVAYTIEPAFGCQLSHEYLFI